MEDSDIVRLYWARDDGAIPATAETYGRYCMTVAMNILGSREDAEECVNDTWLRAWESIPPQRPEMLRTYLGKITRNLAINRYRRNTADKRGSGEAAAVLDEIEAFTPAADTTLQALELRALTAAIDEFLAALPREQRIIFLCRYWYFDPVRDIAQRLGKRENSVSAALSRLRTKLRRHLEERGFEL